MTKTALIGTLCYLGASIAWGFNIPITSILFHTFDPFFLSVLRPALATLVLAAIIGMANPRHLGFPIFPGHLVLLSLAMSGFFVLFNLGLKFSHPITAAAIMAATPVYSAITMRLVLRAKLEPGFWGAAALTVLGTGIAILSRSPGAAESLQLQGGEALIVIGFVCWNLYSIFAQRWFAPEVSQLRRTYVAMVGSVAWMTLAWIVMLATELAPEPNLSPEPMAIVWLLLTAVFSAGLSNVAWNIGVASVGLAAGSLWQNTVPVFAVLASLLFNIVPTGGQVFGGALVLAGVAYLQWRRSSPEARRLSSLTER